MRHRISTHSRYLLCLTAASLLAAGCSGGDPAPEETAQTAEFEGADELLAALEEGGIECAATEIVATPGRELALCESSRLVSVAVYDDQRVLDEAVRSTQDPDETFIAGQRWLIIARSPEAGHAVRDTVGGVIL